MSADTWPNFTRILEALESRFVVNLLQSILIAKIRSIGIVLSLSRLALSCADARFAAVDKSSLIVLARQFLKVSHHMAMSLNPKP